MISSPSIYGMLIKATLYIQLQLYSHHPVIKTQASAAFPELMLNWSKDSRFDTQLCLVESDIILSKAQCSSVINS